MRTTWRLAFWVMNDSGIEEKERKWEKEKGGGMMSTEVWKRGEGSEPALFCQVVAKQVTVCYHHVKLIPYS